MPILYVIPEPFAFLDEEGVPAAALPFDPEHGAGMRRWVGAVIDVGRTRFVATPGAGAPLRFQGQTRQGVGAAPSQRTFFAYTLEPQPVLDTAHYRRAIAAADGVLPADEATARECGVPWRPWRERLAECAAAAVAQWERDHHALPAFDLWPANLRALVPSLSAAPAAHPLTDSGAPS